MSTSPELTAAAARKLLCAWNTATELGMVLPEYIAIACKSLPVLNKPNESDNESS